MNVSLQTFIRDRFPAIARPLSVTVVYEDGGTHEQATSLFEFLIKETEDEAELTATWWRTSLLTDPKLARVATRALGAADMIIVSLHAERLPSRALRSWIDTWPVRYGRPVQLVGLFLGRDETPTQSQWDWYLGEVARERNMIYVPGSLDGLSEAPSPAGSTAPAPGTAWLPSESQVPEPYLHWGLNE